MELLKAIQDNISYYLAAKSIAPQEVDKWEKAFASIPASRYHSLAQQLKNNVLKKIEEKTGTNNEQFKFYFSLYEALIFLTTMIDREDYYKYQLSSKELELQFYKSKLAFYENELQKFTTIESLLTKESALEAYNTTTKKQWI